MVAGYLPWSIAGVHIPTNWLEIPDHRHGKEALTNSSTFYTSPDLISRTVGLTMHLGSKVPKCAFVESQPGAPSFDCRSCQAFSNEHPDKQRMCSDHLQMLHIYGGWIWIVHDIEWKRAWMVPEIVVVHHMVFCKPLSAYWHRMDRCFIRMGRSSDSGFGLWAYS